MFIAKENRNLVLLLMGNRKVFDKPLFSCRNSPPTDTPEIKNMEHKVGRFGSDDVPSQKTA